MSKLLIHGNLVMYLRWQLGFLGGAKLLANFQYWSTLLIWIKVGQGPTVLAICAVGHCLYIFFLSSIISLFLSLHLGNGPL